MKATMPGPIEPVRAESTIHDLDRALLGALSWLRDARRTRTEPATRLDGRDPVLLGMLGLVSLLDRVERRLPAPGSQDEGLAPATSVATRKDWLR